VDLVQQVLRTSSGAPCCPRRRRGLAVAAGLVLAAGLLWSMPLRLRLHATGSHPVVRAQAWSEAPRSTSVPLLVAPPLQPLAPPPPPRAEATHASGGGPTLGAGDARLEPQASLERPRLERPPALAPRVPPMPPAPSPGMALKACDTLKAEIQAKLNAKSLTGYALTILAPGELAGQQVVGSCEGNTKRIVLNRSRHAQ